MRSGRSMNWTEGHVSMRDSRCGWCHMGSPMQPSSLYLLPQSEQGYTCCRGQGNRDLWRRAEKGKGTFVPKYQAWCSTEGSLLMCWQRLRPTWPSSSPMLWCILKTRVCIIKVKRLYKVWGEQSAGVQLESGGFLPSCSNTSFVIPKLTKNKQHYSIFWRERELLYCQRQAFWGMWFKVSRLAVY